MSDAVEPIIEYDFAPLPVAYRVAFRSAFYCDDCCDEYPPDPQIGFFRRSPLEPRLFKKNGRVYASGVCPQCRRRRRLRVEEWLGSSDAAQLSRELESQPGRSLLATEDFGYPN